MNGLVGLFLRIPFFSPVPTERLFSDSSLWELEEEEDGKEEHHQASTNLGANSENNGSYGAIGVTNLGMEMGPEKGMADSDA